MEEEGWGSEKGTKEVRLETGEEGEMREEPTVCLEDVG